MDRTVNLRRYYNERHHGKEPTDDVGGSIRNRIYRYAMSYKCVIKSPNEFSNYANKVVNGITSLYLPEDDLLTKVDHIEEVLKIPETLSIHMLVRNWLLILSHSSHSLTEWMVTPKFLVMNYYHWIITQTCAFWKGHYEGKMSNGSTNFMFLNNFMLDIWVYSINRSFLISKCSLIYEY